MSSHTKDRPNILFFFTDDQRFDTIRALGNEEIITPTLDSFVEKGTTFSHGYIMGGTSGAVCMPSRAMLMSGRTLFHIDDLGQDIPTEHVMLGETLQGAGYATFGTGKWHNGPPAYGRSFSSGDRIFFGGMSDHYKVPLNAFDPTGVYPKEQIYFEEKKHSSDLFSGAAIEFLRSYEADGPFFAYVSFTAPHDPRDTHPKYHAMYDAEKISLPENFMVEHPFDNGELWVRDEKLAAWPRTPEEIRTHIAEYYAMITHVDAQIGAVMAALEESGHAENTIVVFAGDNGLAVGRHGLMGKQNMYEHSVHVPLIMCGPGIPEGETRDAFCYLLDIYPTLCDLIDVPVPESVEGRSLLPILQDPTAKVRDTLFFAYRDLQRSVRDEQYKLIEYVVEGQRTTQFFDLQADPWELRDLSDDPEYAEHRARLRGELVRWRDELDDWGERFWEGWQDTDS